MRYIAVILALFLAGCQLPQWRVFQEKTPAPLLKADSQIELERQSADLIARTVTEPPQLKPIAAKLSQSLGAPKEPITDTPEDAEVALVASWNKELVKTQERLDELNKKLERLGGKKIEDTGINLFGPSAGLMAIGFVVLLVMFPPLATVLWWVFRRASGALTRTARAISEYVKENPDAGAKLKAKLESSQDAADKLLIAKIRAKLKQ